MKDKTLAFETSKAVRYEGLRSQRVGKIRDVSLPDSEGFPLEELAKFSKSLGHDTKK